VQAAGLAASDTATTAQTGSGLLAKSSTVSFTTGSYSTLRLQQLLAQLGYLPLTFIPAASAIVSGDATRDCRQPTTRRPGASPSSAATPRS
jgi:hypothetical protein